MSSPQSDDEPVTVGAVMGYAAAVGAILVALHFTGGIPSQLWLWLGVPYLALVAALGLFFAVRVAGIKAGAAYARADESTQDAIREMAPIVAVGAAKAGALAIIITTLSPMCAAVVALYIMLGDRKPSK